MTSRGRYAGILAAVLVLASAVVRAQETPPDAKVVFLDNRQGVVDGSTTYDPATRTCGGGKDRVFTELAKAADALADADVLFVREGVYSRESSDGLISVHGSRVDYWTGALAVRASGTPERRKRVSAYCGETVVIQAKPGVSHYNPDPDDTTFRNSSHFYPRPAISIGGSWVDVSGFKTFGQVVISGHDVTLEGCDLGGGGPHMNQGQVVALNSNRPGGVYNVVIRNNRIHHSSWGESRANAAALMCYNASFIVENNEFADNHGADVRIKDTGGQQGRDVVIRFNFFGRSSLAGGGNVGTGGLNQDKQIDRILIHHNVFFEKAVGASTDGDPPGDPPARGMFVFNNTFVNCRVDAGGWTNARIHLHNNLSYHTRPNQHYYDVQAKTWDRLDADHNLFFSTAGDTAWRNLYRDRASDLAGWQRHATRDTASVFRDPGFVRPDGSRPEDFKRRGAPGTLRDVEGSPHGPVCGAYVTGNEVIGLVPQPPVKPAR